ncbi:MAG: T9SS type A sorting domain-containing protein [Ignavibacteriaceae bacterium]|nr:T9SS type A sorting domain-containing protein [Ignavibacteriaceae bacterium]
MPAEYLLEQNFPNPFNPSTRIRYSSKEKGFVSLKVYDILGNELMTIVNEVKSPGIFETEFNAANLPSGVYIYSLRVNEFISNQKMIVLK